MTEISLFAPAKINLTLEVMRRQRGGYHEVRSIMQTVGLGDNLSFISGDDLYFECDLPGWQAEQSLVSRAAALLAGESGSRAGAAVRITKRIPLSSGLGGDASDAAAVLRGLSRLWQLEITPGRLTELAAELGSDVPFFLEGGTALARGRGEVVSPLPAPVKCWLIIMTPEVPRPPEKTAAVYACLSAADYTFGGYTAALAARLTRGAALTGGGLYNVFEGVAYDIFPGLALCREAMLAAGAFRVHLAGAGPSLFSLHMSLAEAERVYGALSEYPVFLVEVPESER